MLPRVKAVRVVGPFRIEQDFTDGTRGSIDMTQWILPRGGVFTALHEPDEFARVSVDHGAGTIVWPNGADIDPDVLYAAAHGVDGQFARS